MENIELDPAFPTESVRKHETKPAIPWGWLRALLYIFAAMLGTVIGQGTAMLIVLYIKGVPVLEVMGDQSRLQEILGEGDQAILTFCGFIFLLLITWIFRKFIDRKSMVSLGFKLQGYGKDLIWGLSLGAILIASGTIVLIFTGNLSIVEYRFEFIPLLQSLLLFVIVAFNEEIMVRGYVLNNLSDSMNKYIALGVSALLFMVFHLGNPNVSAVGMLNIFLAGIVLGIYYIHKQNLWLPIGMHLTWNFFQGPVFGYEVSGQKTTTIIVQDLQGSELLTGGEFGLEGSLVASVIVIIITAVLHFQYQGKANKAAA
jgi:membrane protease YdiL (CAAX protease family)